MGASLRKRDVKRLLIKSLLRSLKMQKQSFLTVLIYQRWNCSAGSDLQRWSKLHLSGANQKLLRSLSKWLFNTFALVEFHVTSNYAVIYPDPAARSLISRVTFWIWGQLLALQIRRCVQPGAGNFHSQPSTVEQTVWPLSTLAAFLYYSSFIIFREMQFCEWLPSVVQHDHSVLIALLSHNQSVLMWRWSQLSALLLAFPIF